MHDIAGIIGVWLSVGLTLCMLSFLYKDNPLYKFGEHLYLGISNGYFIVYSWGQVLKPELLGRIAPKLIFHPIADQMELYNKPPNYWFIIPGLLGIILLFRMIPATTWLSRWSLAFYIGWGSGVAIPSIMASYILRQATSTFAPLFGTVTPDAPLSGFINSWLIFIGVLAGLVYFFFSVEHKGVIGHISKIGIWTLMLAFGASFGSTVMARISLFIGRARYLVGPGAERENFYAFQIQLALIVLFGIVAWLVARNKPKNPAPAPQA